jgi:hypothetical protein
MLYEALTAHHPLRRRQRPAGGRSSFSSLAACAAATPIAAAHALPYWYSLSTKAAPMAPPGPERPPAHQTSTW